MSGLTSDEVSKRIRSGLVNNSEVKTGRTYADIVIKNVVTPINIILFILGAALFLLDSHMSAISATGIITVNILISTIQEIRAKRRLDKIALLTRPKVTVLRDDKEVVIDQNEIVKDDLIIIRTGEQALVDGTLEYCKSLEMDEALLTGESSTVNKKVGDRIYSGSFCITGEGRFVVTAFGNDSYASQMLSSAKKFTTKKTPLQMETQTITYVLAGIAFVLMFLSLITELIRGFSIWEITYLVDVLELFVVCLDIIPVALFLLITLTYMIAAIRMSKTGVLLQRFNSVESMSHVEVVCMDKTGTITTNNLIFETSKDLIDPEEASLEISLFVSSTGSRNKTIIALENHYRKTDCELLEEIQFSSARKYSAVKVRFEGKVHTLYSGAWNVIREHVENPSEVDSIIEEQSSKGFRTLVLCRSEDLPLIKGEEFIINPLTPVSVVSIRDEVRADCRETMDVFMENNMDIKVISGDDPVTVDALFKIADIPGERRIISGPELEQLNESELDKVVLETNIFGRMKPENKEKVIEVLKRNGKYVAMIGDGVNDVKPIKSAQVGIALQSGSGAARGVADMVLVDDDFNALPLALVEGRRTISGIRDILKIYISRNFALAIMYIFMFFIFSRAPMLPVQNMFYAFIAVTVIAFFMTIFAVPDKNDELILPNVIRFSIPSALVIGIIGVIVYHLAFYMSMHGILNIDFSYLDWVATAMGLTKEELINTYLVSGVDYVYPSIYANSDMAARSAMVLFAAVTGALQLLMVCPYFKFLSMDGKVNKRKLPILLVIFVLSLVAIMYIAVPWFGMFIGMVLFSWQGFALSIGASVIAFFLILFIIKRKKGHRLVDAFEKQYMKKLDEMYTKGDVIEEGDGNRFRFKGDKSRP